MLLLQYFFNSVIFPIIHGTVIPLTIVIDIMIAIVIVKIKIISTIIYLKLQLLLL